MTNAIPIYCYLTAFLLAGCSPSTFIGENRHHRRAPLSDGTGTITGGDSNSEDSSGEDSKNPPTPPKGDFGVIGGHFDLDTSTAIYPLNQGKTDGHVHEYDDKYKVEDANFFALKSDSLSNVQEIINPNQRVKIILHNAALSPLAFLDINGTLTPVVDFAKNFNAKDIYSLGGGAGTTKLSALRFVLAKDAFLKKGVLATETGCVRKNEPGKNGEYRSGALVIQLVDADNFRQDATSGFLVSGLLWEASLFWHLKGCY